MSRSEQGVSHDRYTLIPRCLIFVTRGDKLLLLKGAPDKPLWPNLYNGVGGHIERGEDILTAARRELLEETGLTCRSLRLRGIVTVDTGEHIGIGIYVYSGECPSGEAIQSPEGTLEWVDLHAVHSMELVEDLYSLLPMIIDMDPDEAPFSAHYRYDTDDRLVISFADS